jgi:hypothetical protein
MVCRHTGRGLALACAAISTVACTLLAPSDRELTGGNTADGGAKSDAGSGDPDAATDAPGISLPDADGTPGCTACSNVPDACLSGPDCSCLNHANCGSTTCFASNDQTYFKCDMLKCVWEGTQLTCTDATGTCACN